MSFICYNFFNYGNLGLSEKVDSEPCDTGSSECKANEPTVILVLSIRTNLHTNNFSFFKLKCCRGLIIYFFDALSEIIQHFKVIHMHYAIASFHPCDEAANFIFLPQTKGNSVEFPKNSNCFSSGAQKWLPQSQGKTKNNQLVIMHVSLSSSVNSLIRSHFDTTHGDKIKVLLPYTAFIFCPSYFSCFIHFVTSSLNLLDKHLMLGKLFVKRCLIALHCIAHIELETKLKDENLEMKVGLKG